MSGTLKEREALRKAMHDLAEMLPETADGGIIWLVLVGEAVAAVATQVAAVGTTLREPGGVDEIVRGTLAPIERMLRENLAEYLEQERKATRQ